MDFGKDHTMHTSHFLLHEGKSANQNILYFEKQLYNFSFTRPFPSHLKLIPCFQQGWRYILYTVYSTLYILVTRCARISCMSFSHPVITITNVLLYKLTVDFSAVGFLRVFRFQQFLMVPSPLPNSNEGLVQLNIMWMKSYVLVRTMWP